MKRSLLLAAIVCSSSAFGQFTNNDAVNSIVRDSAGPEEVVPICGLNPADGTTFVSWFNQNNQGSYDFSMNALDGNGNYFLTPSGLTVSNYPQGSAIFVYDTKVDHDNKMVTAFQDERSGILDIVAYRMDQSGNFLWGNAGISLTDSAASGGIAPHVGILPNNDAIIAWIAQGSPKSWISFKRINTGGTMPWSGIKRIIDSTGTVAYSRPQMIPMLNDDFFLLYIEQSGNFFPPVSRMFMQRYNPAGDPVWANPVLISTKTTGFVDYPSAVPDAKNGAYIAFATGNPTNPAFNDVYVQHIDENGNLWSVDGTEAGTSSTVQRMSPTIRFENGMTQPMVVYKETDAGQGNAGVTIQAFDSTGATTLGADGIAITPIMGLYDEPYDMRSTGDGMIILYGAGPFGNNQMLATKINYSGTSMWSPATLTVSSVASNKSRGQLTPVFGPSGFEQTVAVWEDDRLDVGVYCQNINSDGTLGISTNITNPTRNTFTASVFPNPAHDNQKLVIESLKEENAVITLFDANGRDLFGSKPFKLQVGTNEISLQNVLSTSKLSAGTYSLSIKGEKNTAKIQLVVN